MNTYTLIQRNGTRKEVPFLLIRDKYHISEHIPQFENRDHTLGYAQHDTGEVVIFEPLIILFEAVRDEVKKVRKKETPIVINSGYRSPEYQKRVYEEDLKANGGKPSGKVARPGRSPHELGVAMDLQAPQGFSVRDFATLIRKVCMDLKYPIARTGYVKYNYQFVHMDLAPMLFKPYTKIENPIPQLWKPGVIW